MRTQISALILVIASQGYQPVTNAFGRKVIDCESAERGFTVSVSNGIGVDLKIACGGDVTDIQLSDPSRFVVRKRGPQHLYVKRISTLFFPGNLSASDGSTMLSVVMTNGSLFQFRVVSGGSGGYSLLDIGGKAPLPLPMASKPKPLPIPQVPQVPEVPLQAKLPSPPDLPQIEETPIPTKTEPVPQIQTTTSTRVETQKDEKSRKHRKNQKKKDPIKTEPAIALSEITPNSFPGFPELKLPEPVKPVPSGPPIEQVKTKSFDPPSKPTALASALLKGLNTARVQRKVVYGSSLWFKTQDAIWVLRNGKSLETASQRSRVKMETLESLLSCTTKLCDIQ
jgi:hypothetical protein